MRSAVAAWPPGRHVDGRVDKHPVHGDDGPRTAALGGAAAELYDRVCMLTMSAISRGQLRGRVPAWGVDGAVYALLAGAGVLLWWWCANDPAALPVWAPWDFAPLQFLSTWLALWWFTRGMLASPAAERPPVWRTVCFVVGLLSIYAVLQTRFDYLAQHMFFLHRAQHIVMHHLGPMLIVLAWPGAVLKHGMPRPLARLSEARWLTRSVHMIQQPLLAAVLFVGLIYFWLLPAVHFRAMIDLNLYAIMNWSMVVDGILFWSLVLDPRPSPPARISFLARGGLALGVMFPQILLGAVIAFSGQDLYGFYEFCGRIYPSIGALRDQTFGGLIIWIPGAMMSVVGLLLVANFLRQAEERALKENADGASHSIQASRWTGL
jgi:putative membrane protein